MNPVEIRREWSLDAKRRRVSPRPRSESDAVIFSKVGRELPIASEKGARTRYPVHVFIAEDGRLPKAPGAWWKKPDVLRFVFTTEASFEKVLQASGDRAFVVAAGKKRVDWSQVLARLARSGLERLRVLDEGCEAGLRKAGFAIFEDLR